jgi:hypothetical protein
MQILNILDARWHANAPLIFILPPYLMIAGGRGETAKSNWL